MLPAYLDSDLQWQHNGRSTYYRILHILVFDTHENFSAFEVQEEEAQWCFEWIREFRVSAITSAWGTKTRPSPEYNPVRFQDELSWFSCGSQDVSGGSSRQNKVWNTPQVQVGSLILRNSVVSLWPLCSNSRILQCAQDVIYWCHGLRELQKELWI